MKKEMKKAIEIKSFKKKYKLPNFFIILIISCIIISLVFSYLLQDYSFLSSALLNVCGGLFTGLIILLYQFHSKMKLNEAMEIVRELELIKEIPIDCVNILDFYTDSTFLNEDQLQENGINIEYILSDEEGVAYALEKYLKLLEEMSMQLNSIIYFSENTLILPLDFLEYQNKLNETFEYFKKYNVEKEYKVGPYILREKDTGDIIDFVSADTECPNNDLYYIDPSGSNVIEVNIVYENDIKVHSKKVYEEWISKMDDLINETILLNSKLNSEKQMIIKYNNNSIIIN